MTQESQRDASLKSLTPTGLTEKDDQSELNKSIQIDDHENSSFFERGFLNDRQRTSMMDLIEAAHMADQADVGIMASLGIY